MRDNMIKVQDAVRSTIRHAVVGDVRGRAWDAGRATMLNRAVGVLNDDDIWRAVDAAVKEKRTKWI